MKEITLYGAGGHCYSAIDLIRSLREFEPIIIVDDNPNDNTILNVPVKKADVNNFKTDFFCISIGNNQVRKKIAKEMGDLNFPSFIHNSVVAFPSVRIGRGTLVHPAAVLDADVILGDFCIVNNNATISHNASIGKYCHIAINAAIAGGVKVGEGSLIGAGACILPELVIGKWVTVGAGSIITKDIPDYAVVYGNPAKIMRYNNES